MTTGDPIDDVSAYVDVVLNAMNSPAIVELVEQFQTGESTSARLARVEAERDEFRRSLLRVLQSDDAIRRALAYPGEDECAPMPRIRELQHDLAHAEMRLSIAEARLAHLQTTEKETPC